MDKSTLFNVDFITNNQWSILMNNQNKTHEAALRLFVYEAKNAGYDIDVLFEKVKVGISYSPVRPGISAYDSTLATLKNTIEEVKTHV